MAEYQAKWHGVTKVSWIKGRAEKGEAKTNAHEQHNQRADADTEAAYAQADSPTYRGGYC